MLVVSIIQFLPLLWGFPRFFQSARNFVEREVPEFRAELKGGLFTVYDVEQPFIKTYSDDESGKEFIFVLDTVTTTPLNIQDYLPNEDAFGILITRTNAMIYDVNTGDTRIQQWKTIPNQNFTRTDLMEIVRKFTGALST